MARIAGVDLPNNKQGEIGLTYIFGIGRSSAKRILEKCGIDPTIKVGDWNDDQIAKIRTEINEEYKIEGELRSSVQMDIKRLMDIGCYRGIRHRLGLPVRGQSTKNNARTRRDMIQPAKIVNPTLLIWLSYHSASQSAATKPTILAEEL